MKEKCQISTESNRQRNYSVLGVCVCGYFFLMWHIFIFFYFIEKQSKAYTFKKDKFNRGRNIKGQPKKWKPRRGVAGTEFVEDSEKRKQTLYQRKKTLFKTVIKL